MLLKKMFEFFVDILLCVCIVFFWYLNFKKPKESLSQSPCRVNGQVISDPYGILYTCDEKLEPVVNKSQITDIGDDEWYDAINQTLRKFTSVPEKTVRFRKRGLEPLDFNVGSIVEPFEVVGDKIVWKDACYGKDDGTKVGIPPGKEIPNGKGSPYGLCRNGIVDKIEFCPKFNIFENGECVFSNPCMSRSDGYILEVTTVSYKFCKNQQVDEVVCKDSERLINLKCIGFPCMNMRDGLIIDFDEANNSYRFCSKEVLLKHFCKPNQRASELGCVDKRCSQLDGLNFVRRDKGLEFAQYAVECNHGKVVKLVFDEFVDQSLYNIYLRGGRHPDYYPHLIRPGRCFSDKGWMDLIDLLGRNGVIQFYVLFKLRRNDSKLKPNVYYNDFVLVQFYLDDKRVFQTRVEEVYFEGMFAKGEIMTTFPYPVVSFAAWFSAQNKFDYYMKSKTEFSDRLGIEKCGLTEVLDTVSEKCISFERLFEDDGVGVIPSPDYKDGSYLVSTAANKTGVSVICGQNVLRYRTQDDLPVDVVDVRDFSRYSFNVFKQLYEFGIPVAKVVHEVVYIRSQEKVEIRSTPCGKCHDTLPVIVELSLCRSSRDRWVVDGKKLTDCQNNHSIRCDHIRLDAPGCIELPSKEYVPLIEYVGDSHMYINFGRIYHNSFEHVLWRREQDPPVFLYSYDEDENIISSPRKVISEKFGEQNDIYRSFLLKIISHG